MTMNDLQQAAVIQFAAREVGDGTVEQMKAVCHCLRNRLAAGWAENIFTIVENATDPWASAHGPASLGVKLDFTDRRLRELARDIEQILYPLGGMTDDVARICGRQDRDRGPLLYWNFINRPTTDWFRDNIARSPQHPNRAQFSFLYLYE